MVFLHSNLFDVTSDWFKKTCEEGNMWMHQGSTM